jgi:hypothetical protein
MQLNLFSALAEIGASKGARARPRALARSPHRLVLEPVRSSVPQRENEKETLTRTGVSRDSEDTDFTGDTLMPRTSERASRVRVAIRRE